MRGQAPACSSDSSWKLPVNLGVNGDPEMRKPAVSADSPRRTASAGSASRLKLLEAAQWSMLPKVTTFAACGRSDSHVANDGTCRSEAMPASPAKTRTSPLGTYSVWSTGQALYMLKDNDHS